MIDTLGWSCSQRPASQRSSHRRRAMGIKSHVNRQNNATAPGGTSCEKEPPRLSAWSLGRHGHPPRRKQWQRRWQGPYDQSSSSSGIRRRLHGTWRSTAYRSMRVDGVRGPSGWHDPRPSALGWRVSIRHHRPLGRGFVDRRGSRRTRWPDPNHQRAAGDPAREKKI